MANVDAAFGLRPINRDGSAWNGAAQEVYWAADTSNTLYVGDAVKLTGTGDDNGIPAVARAEAGEAFYGVLMGIAGDSNEDLTRDTPRFLSTSAGYGLVAVANDEQLYEIQEDSGGAALAKTDIGRNANLIYGSPSTSHPIRSAAELDSSTAATTSASMQVQIVALKRAPDNAIGNNAIWIVRANALQTAEV